MDLFLAGKKFLQTSPFPDPVYPEVIQFPVNDICNSKCQMCNIWKQKKEFELSLDQIEELYSQPLFKNVETVGLNGGEPTLRKDLPQIVERLKKSLPSLKNISLITNSIIHKRVIAYIEEMAKICLDNGLHFDVMCSLDGVGDVHDRVRGRSGNFESVEKVIDAAKKIKGVSSLRVGCTIIKENVFDVEEVLFWAIKNKVYARFRIGIPHQRLYKGNDADVFGFNDEERFHLINFLEVINKYYEKTYSRRLFYTSLKNQLLYNAPRNVGCSWKYRGATVTSKGELAYCAVESDILGNLLEQDGEELYWGNADHLKQIQKEKCANCNHDYQGLLTKKQFVLNLVDGAMRRYAPVSKSIKYIKKFRNRNSAKRVAAKKIYTSAENAENLDQILICGWYGTETLGDQAILAQLVQNVRKLYPNHLIHLSSLDKTVSNYTDLKNEDCKVDEILSLSEAEKRIAAKAYSHLIFGGGPIMSTVSKINEMSYFFRLAKHNGTKTIIYGAGVGPVVENDNLPNLITLIENSDHIVNRDAKSAGLSVRYASMTEVEHACDPAMIWFRDKYRSDLEKSRLNKVTFALREIPFSQYHSEKDENLKVQINKKFEHEVRDLIQKIKGEDGSEVELFCMNKLAIGDDDRLFYAKLLNLDRQNNEGINMDIRHGSVNEYIKHFYNSKVAVCMRYHSVCLALATKTPFIAIDYTNGGKTKNLLNDLGLMDLYIDVNEFTSKKAAKLMKDAPIILEGKKEVIDSYLDSSELKYEQLLRK